MDKASKVLTQAPPEVCGTWAAMADWGGVSTTTLYKRAHGQPSIEDKARGQQYLTVEEEKALTYFLLLMSSFGQPVRIKYIPTLAYSIARRRSTASKLIKPPGINWPRVLDL
jgi:hypothetical protein